MVGLHPGKDHTTLLVGEPAQAPVLGEPAQAAWLLCSLADDGTVTVWGSLPPPPERGMACALWAGWGPPPAAGSEPALDRQRRPWIVAHSPGDLRIWIHVPPDAAGRRVPALRRGSWWFTRPLDGVRFTSVVAAFAADATAVYLPYLVRPVSTTAPADLRVLWFRTRWRDEPAEPLRGAAELLDAVGWEGERDGVARLLLVWRDVDGACHWGRWMRVAESRWVRDGWGRLDGAAGCAENALLTALPVPGGGARALALANPRVPDPASASAGGAETDPADAPATAAGLPALVRWDFSPVGEPSRVALRWANGGTVADGRSGTTADAPTGPAAIVGWWTSGTADLVLLLHGTGDSRSGPIEGWLVNPDGTCRRLGRVAAGVHPLRRARVAVAGEEPVIPCRLPLHVPPQGIPRPWAVPPTWLDALRIHGAGGWSPVPGVASSPLRPPPGEASSGDATQDGAPRGSVGAASFLPPDPPPERFPAAPSSPETPGAAAHGAGTTPPGAPDDVNAGPVARPPRSGPLRHAAPRMGRGEPSSRPPRWRTVPRPDGS